MSIRSIPVLVLVLAIITGPLAAEAYYVAPGGDDGNDGTSLDQAFATIDQATALVEPGDTVWIADGTYHQNPVIRRSGAPGAFITIRSIDRWGAKIVGSGGSDGFHIRGDYIELSGIELTNPGGHGFNCETANHVRIIDCHAYGCGNSGISGAWGDFYHFEGNVCHDNASSSWYSGISIYQAKAIGDDRPGFHIVIRNNVCYDNVSYGAPHTDGNGIIIDDWNSTQRPGTPYPYEALVENNICYGNGGAGIKTVWSDRVTVRNNICYRNNLDLLNTGTYRGELYCQDSRDITWVNNIAIADPGVDPHNSAAMDKGTPSGTTDTPNRWVNNILFVGSVGVDATDIGDGSRPTLAGNRNGVDPLLVDPSGGDFHFRPTSPAIDGGSAAYGIPADDLDGVSRPRGEAVDVGAYEYATDTGSRTITMSPLPGIVWTCDDATTTSVDPDTGTTILEGIDPEQPAVVAAVPSGDI